MTNGNSAERERFETAYLKRYPNIKFLDPERFSLDEQGEYRRTIVEVSWQLWQEGRDQGYVSGYSDGMCAYQWSDQQKQDDLTEVESLAKCEPEEDGSLSVNELFAMQAENAAPTPERAQEPEG